MTRTRQSRAVARDRQPEPSALAHTGEHLGTDELLTHRAGVAVVSHDRSADNGGLPAVCCGTVEARHVEQLEDHIRRVVDAAPPLTAEQRKRLALLLTGR